MGKLLRMRDYILLGAALAGDIIDETRLVGGLLPSAMENRYGYVPIQYKRGSYRSTVYNMLSVGDLSKEVDKNGRVFLTVSSKGDKKLKRKFPLMSLARSKWDGKFIVAVFDISEKDRPSRDGLRIKLTELGFGMLQKSVWISPYHFEEDLREFLVGKSLSNEAFVLSAEKLWAGNEKKLAEKVWKLKEINQSYLKVAKQFRSSKSSTHKSMKKERRLKESIKHYLKTLSKDPLLPKELLPDYWAREGVLANLNKAIKRNKTAVK